MTTLKNTNLGEEKENRFFCSSVNDLLKKHKKSGRTFYTSFLSEYELSQAVSVLENHCDFSIWGGFDYAQRNIVSAGFSEKADFPIDCIGISNNEKSVSLTHRNILGSLMSMGIERNVIGDILIKDDHSAYVFCLSKMSEFICENLNFISHDSCFVKIEDSDFIEIPQQQFEFFQISVASCRLDCFVSAVVGISRTKTKEMFDGNLIFLNSRPQKNPEKIVKELDTVSIRGYGKFIVDSYIKESRKGKLQYKIRKFN